MKWYEFTKRLPSIDSCVLVACEDQSFGFINITSEVYRILKSGCHYDYIEVCYYNDAEEGCFDLSCARWWCYPSTIDIPEYLDKVSN